MKTYNLPYDLNTDPSKRDQLVTIRAYHSSLSTVRNRIVLHQNMINLIIQGSKTVVYPEGVITVKAGQFLVLSEGNCLTSEVISGEDDFSSIILYFDNSLLTDFFIRYNEMLRSPVSDQRRLFLLYNQDDFVKHFVGSVDIMLGSANFTPALQRIKIEELLLYMYEIDPQKFLSLMAKGPDNEELALRRVVECNIDNNISVDELAFLCNASLSTFKRRFGKIYGTSPQKFLLEKRMLKAAALLSQASERPGLVYEKVGYENHASFSRAFKQQFGLTPSNYQAKQLNVQQQ